MEFPALFRAAFAAIIVVYESLKWTVTPGDSGGETVAGISRVAWPMLPLWLLIDAKKSAGVDMHHFMASDDPIIYDMVKQFYYEEFWCRCGCWLMGAEASKEMFDTAVNCGTGIATLHLQEILNAMNCNEKRWPDIPTDKVFGKGTAEALKMFLATQWKGTEGAVNADNFLRKLLNHKQSNRYFAIMANNHSQEQFAVSWMNRT